MAAMARTSVALPTRIPDAYDGARDLPAITSLPRSLPRTRAATLGRAETMLRIHTDFTRGLTRAAKPAAPELRIVESYA